MKLKVNEPENAVKHCSYSGPKFGSGYDLYVSDESNTDRKGFMSLSSYEFPNEKSDREGGQFIVGGDDWSFQTTEVEVFKVLSKRKLEATNWK